MKVTTGSLVILTDSSESFAIRLNAVYPSGKFEYTWGYGDWKRLRSKYQRFNLSDFAVESFTGKLRYDPE